MKISNVSYSSTISACEKGKQWRLALDLLQEMVHQSVSQDEVGHSSAISACQKSTHWEGYDIMICCNTVIS